LLIAVDQPFNDKIYTHFDFARPTGEVQTMWKLWFQKVELPYTQNREI